MALSPDDIKLLAGVVSGGAAGSVITAIVTSWRNRRPRVGYRVAVYPVLGPKPDDVSLVAQAYVPFEGSHGNAGVTFDNLFLARITISNEGPTDHTDGFRFSVKLRSTKDFEIDGIRAEGTGPDFKHIVADVSAQPWSPVKPGKVADVELKPFNRGEVYDVRLYITVRTPDARAVKPSDLSVATAGAARMVNKDPWAGEEIGGV